MDKVVSRKAYAKINLSLDVLRRRDDGYHEVKMIMQQVDIWDELTFKIDENASEQITLRVLNAPVNADLGPVEKNLIYRAAKLILDEYGRSEKVSISLSKNIPVAAGMAGGSTDAAAVFHGLNELLDLGMSDTKMCQMGVKLGADIPYCIMGGTMLAEGIGELLSPLPTPPECVLLIAKPDIAVSTKYVYENLHANELKEHPDVDAMIEAIKAGRLEDMANLLGNVLQNVSCMAYPIIEDIKKVMIDGGAMNSLMSGSGPTVFGIFDSTDLVLAEACAEKIKADGLAHEVFVTYML